MTVKDWVHYYENEERDRLLNVISLEFSHTRLEDYVDQPEVVSIELYYITSATPAKTQFCSISKDACVTLYVL